MKRSSKVFRGGLLRKKFIKLAHIHLSEVEGTLMMLKTEHIYTNFLVVKCKFGSFLKIFLALYLGMLGSG